MAAPKTLGGIRSAVQGGGRKAEDGSHVHSSALRLPSSAFRGGPGG